jgi:hypothetical protein
MIGILVDRNIERQGQLLWGQFAEPDWQAMQVASMTTLFEAGLDPDATDLGIWTFCQKRQLLWLTANRNRQGDDSLQAVLDERNEPTSLPVLTVSNPNRALVDALYRELCAYRIADIALELPRHLGMGRLFIP